MRRVAARLAVSPSVASRQEKKAAIAHPSRDAFSKKIFSDCLVNEKNFFALDGKRAALQGAKDATRGKQQKPFCWLFLLREAEQ